MPAKTVGAGALERPIAGHLAEVTFRRELEFFDKQLQNCIDDRFSSLKFTIVAF